MRIVLQRVTGASVSIGGELHSSIGPGLLVLVGVAKGDTREDALSTRKGNRPSYINAAGHELAVPLYELYCSECARLTGREVKTGVFGADMEVRLVNDGPVTIVIDSKE